MKILIIKIGAMGDVVRTTTIIPALKEKYRYTEIYWLTKKNAYSLIKDNKFVDEAVYYSKINLRYLEGMYFDIVINLDEDFEACALATKIKTGKIIGNYLDKNLKVVPSESAKEWYDMSKLGKKPQNDILKKKNKKTYQQIISDMVGVDYDKTFMNLKLNREQGKFLNDFKRRYNIREDDIVIGVNTGSGGVWPSKKLSIEKTAKLAEMLYKNYKYKILLFGGQDEIERNDNIISLSKVPIINTGCGNDLFEFPALIAICNVFVTSDSLGLHLAVALKRKVVVLVGPTSAAELDLYGQGIRLTPNSNCLCCYKPDCQSMNKMNVDNIVNAANRLIKNKLSIIVTSFKEPNLPKAIDSIIKQQIDYDYEIIIASPDEEAKTLFNKLNKKQNIKYFKDPGTGKSYAINLLFKELKGDILIFTDGDVVLGENSINEIARSFFDLKTGCVTGRIVSSNSKEDIFGYWSHLLADAGAHKIRKKLSEQGKFLECSGYLFAFRNNIINKIPLDVAEDSIIPYYFWKRGYKIKYVKEAKVFVKNPDNFNEWFKQRKRTAKAHETLTKHAPDFPRVKSFFNEVFIGTFWALSYPQDLREFWWTLRLFFARLYMWISVYYDTRLIRKHYNDAWERVESTK